MTDVVEVMFEMRFIMMDCILKYSSSTWMIILRHFGDCLDS